MKTFTLVASLVGEAFAPSASLHFLFARALRLPSRNCWAAPGLLEEELEEEEESSSSLEVSFQQEIVVV